jgi:hypothetical protein
MNPEETLQLTELCVQIIAQKDEARYPELLRQLEAIVDQRETGLPGANSAFL